MIIDTKEIRFILKMILRENNNEDFGNVVNEDNDNN